MKIYNSLTKSLEKFEVIKNKEISMYVCGPTVYDRIHIGNARSVIVFDFIYRFLKEKFKTQGYEIKYVRNITDVDDKIIKRAGEMGISEKELSETMTEFFHKDLKYLNCLKPTKEPKVTEEIEECIKIIEQIIANGYAYEKDGNVLFSVARYKEYGALSGREIENNINLTREIKKVEKEDLNDFILWKKTDIGITWNSPWGKGRPGWHIECSAMSKKYLGENFDIHGGGLDLKFPHHENEIAQSKCASLNSTFAKYWVHNGILTVNGEKMSKSLGNFITIDDLEKKGVNPYVTRIAILSAHYRNPLDFSEKLIYDWEIRLKDIVNNIAQNKEIIIDNKEQDKEEVLKILENDFNSNLLILKIIEWSKNKEFNKICFALNILGVDIEKYLEFEQEKETKTKVHPSYQEAFSLAQERIGFKQQKNFQKADEIRKQIENLGFIIEDLPKGEFLLKIKG